MPRRLVTNPFRTAVIPPLPVYGSALKTPQARILAALMPRSANSPPHEYPCLTRAILAKRAGYTPVSGSVTRALHGIKPGSSSGEAHLGLLSLALVEAVEIDLDGITETNYRITVSGMNAYHDYLEEKGGSLPKYRGQSAFVNRRYKQTQD